MKNGKFEKSKRKSRRNMIYNKICIPTSRKIDDFVRDKKIAEIHFWLGRKRKTKYKMLGNCLIVIWRKLFISWSSPLLWPQENLYIVFKSCCGLNDEYSICNLAIFYYWNYIFHEITSSMDVTAIYIKIKTSIVIATSNFPKMVFILRITGISRCHINMISRNCLPSK